MNSVCPGSTASARPPPRHCGRETASSSRARRCAEFYRDRLRDYLPAARFLFLTGERDLIARRLASRRDHFVGLSLLDSQLAVLEPLASDEAGMVLDVAFPVESLVDQVLADIEVGTPTDEGGDRIE